MIQRLISLKSMLINKLAQIFAQPLNVIDLLNRERKHDFELNIYVCEINTKFSWKIHLKNQHFLGKTEIFVFSLWSEEKSKFMIFVTFFRLFSHVFILEGTNSYGMRMWELIFGINLIWYLTMKYRKVRLNQIQSNAVRASKFHILYSHCPK